MLRDPDVIKKISVQDFDCFSDHTPMMAGTSENDLGSDQLFANSLFVLRGQKWRDMRATLSPAFTGSKMRHMFELVVESAKSMADFFKAEARAGKRLEYEMKDTLSRFSNDVIATVAFGIKVDSMRERENDFYVKGKQMINFQSITVLLKFFFLRSFPSLSQKLKIDILDKDLAAYFKTMILDRTQRYDSYVDGSSERFLEAPEG